jgi:hypothetical protein
MTIRGKDVLVSVVTKTRAGQPENRFPILSRGRDISTAFKLVFGPTEPPIQWVWDVLPSKIKRSWPLTSSSADSKNTWSYTPISPYVFIPSYSIKDTETIAQAISRWLPTAAVRGSRSGLSCGILWWTKWRWGRFSPSTSVFPAKFYSTDCSKNRPHLSSGFVQ